MGLYNLLNVDNVEHLYHMANMSEANWVMGVKCTFIPCLSYTRDINSDPHPVYGEPIEINVVFDDDPKATLKKYNWLAEDEDLPYLVNISSIVYNEFSAWKKSMTHAECKAKLSQGLYNGDGTVKDEFKSFIIPVSDYAMIEMPYKLNAEGTQKFVITSIRGDSINPFMWLCKLAPHHDQVDLKPETTDVDSTLGSDSDADYNYLKVK